MKPITELVQSQLCDLAPYKPGKSAEAVAREHGIAPEDIVKLASNENPAGMSPKVQQAAQVALSNGHRYPDGHVLRQAIAAHTGLQTDQVVLGNGSNDVLDLIARVFLGPDTTAVSSQYGFIVYRLVTKIVGAKHTMVPAKAFGHDLAAMRAAINEETKVVWIANPNNPTGTFIPHAELRTFLQNVPKDVIVVLDEAYHEYVASAGREDTTTWLTFHPNLILTRTFSKAYGLAGLRVGYALASPVIADMLNRVRQPFNVSVVGLAAAVAALEDQQFVQESAMRNQVSLKELKAGLDALRVAYLPTFGNFITVELENAADVCQKLLVQGVVVRPLMEYDMPNYVRITAGLPADNKRVLAALQAALI
jgi:histidinol-phosphate aminotransferase